ncbi:tyrosine-type recombinase/integrase [Candidatus Symbiopectobacterium sp. NZEC135]|uniref:tyrosine-type recombinase/integrase n=1 Tax=Candidatus Symbiopectobacterium sp. NZEC135 TaxID=2820471 RepID=UPI002226C7FB|nr:integrase arm-type DNA-binding domain-containing protein [Candidatus Symbiopectobacterium sp. NZEC135]MCW2478011.1 tyrosine-type recombinase/integrase [Candidatus Symbiopectobacterium sp. NZEC135]
MVLSAIAVRQAKAIGKAYTIPDDNGLSLYVTSSGGKSWHFRYYWLGKQQRLSLGTYPKVSLQEARNLRDETRALLDTGINPQANRKQKRYAIQLAVENDFESVFNKWVEYRSLELKEDKKGTLSQIHRTFNNDILPQIGKRSVYDIRRIDLLKILSKIEQRRAFTTAEKARSWLGQLFRFAVVKIDGLDINPAMDLKEVALPKPPEIHNPFLHMSELPSFLCKLRKYSGNETTQLGIRLLFLTGVRTGELRLATPEQFDLERGLWLIPPEEVKQLQKSMRKNRKRPQDIPPYIVPLSAQAIEIIRYLIEKVKPAQHYLLPHYYNPKERISENTLNNALKRMGYKDKLTGHGIRGTMSTALNEIGYPKVWVDAQLSHSDPNKVSSAYNHANYVEPRRRMMQDWADRLDLLEQGFTESALEHLTIYIAGIPTVLDTDRDLPISPLATTIPAITSTPRVTTDGENKNGTVFKRLSPLPSKPCEENDPGEIITEIQKKRIDMLNIYEKPHNLSVSQFAKLAGKSRDQINREIKANKLLTINIGNRGQRIPDWQLDPIKQKLIQSVLKLSEKVDSWTVYQALSNKIKKLNNQSPIDVVNANNLHEIIPIINKITSTSIL